MPGRVAARTMAWRRRMGSVAGPLSASGEASNGQPVQVEILINGAWVDITAYVMVRDNSGNISISRGQRDEGGRSEQSTCQMTLNNRDGRWSPRNPTGAYYGSIGRNQPIRVSVPNGLGGKSYRFQGEVSQWPQSWDPTGTDIWTSIEGSGILRRLAQGPAPALSVIHDALTSPVSPNLRAYWPMEDAAESTSFASVLPNGSPMTWSGVPDLASYNGFSSSDPVAVTSNSVYTGGIARYGDPTATQVRFLCHFPSDGLTNDKTVCAITNGDDAGLHWFELVYTTTGHTLFLQALNGDGAFLGISLDHTLDVRGRSLYVSIELQESGANIARAVRLYDLNQGISYDVSDTAASGNLSNVTYLEFGNAGHDLSGSAGLSEVAIGHVTVEDTITSNTILGVRLNPVGETAGRRIQRMCGEEGIAFESVGDLDETVAMGGQDKLNPLSLMQECEDADSGVLYESMPVLGLGYRTRDSLTNQDAQLTLNYTAYNLSEVPTPVEDDRYIQNKVTVTVSGISATYEETEGVLSTVLPPAGVGVYGQDITLNLEDSDDAMGHAAWRVHLGTVDEPRYPQISVNLAHSSFVSNPALKQAVLGLRQGDRIVVQNPPSWLPPGDIDQIILGFEETITHFEHRLTFVCAPSSPYNTIGILDAVGARMDTDGSRLAAAVTAGATSLSVETTSGPIWVQYGQLNTNADFETDLSGWAGSGATIARVATPGTPSFTSVWSMQITPDGVSEFPNSGSDLIAVTVGEEYVLEGWLYCVTARTVALNINWFDGGAGYLSTSSNDAAVAVNTWTRFTLTATAPVGAAFANLAPTVPSFPPAADVLYADEIVFRRSDEVAFSDDFPFDIRVGGEVMTVTSISDGSSPQTFTVTRAVNGITKAHAAGADVRLASPTYLAL